MGTSDWFSEDFENVGSPRKSGHFTKSRSRFQRAKSGRPAEKESTAQSEPKVGAQLVRTHVGQLARLCPPVSLAAMRAHYQRAQQ